MIDGRTVERRRVRRKGLRTVLALFVFAAVVIIGVAAWVYAAGHAALPQVDGDIVLPGLRARVAVTRDKQGVPHIAAATLEDLFFAQGYVTAQDRLWQMDMGRRYAAGELAELLGRELVEHDRRQRILRLRVVAENAAANLSLRDRSFFEAYARGVNAYIAGQDHLPLEFRVLRYRPQPWTVTDSCLIAANLVQTLTLKTLSHQLAREKISAQLGPELAAELYPNSSWRDRPPASAASPDEFVPSEDNEEQEEEQPPPPARHISAPRATSPVSRHPFPARMGNQKRETGDGFPGSNNWVISGAHTASGKPLLSNDMHLRHYLPNVWYEAHLTGGALDVAGVTLPGFPFVIVGHNQRIAWGFTNVGAAVSDLYVEKFNATGEYQTPEGWQQPEHHRAVIHVAHAGDEVLDVVVTRHGPIVSGLQPGERRKFALKWTAYPPQQAKTGEAEGFQIVPFFDIDSAQDWQQFREALRHFVTPAQNVVYADVDGHIAYQAAGMIPIRLSGDGSLPVPGADDSHEWMGYIPFEQMPSVLDPPSGILATANGRITPNEYPYVISNEWGPPYRTERIYRRLGGERKVGSGDMLRLQTDIYSEFDHFCAQRFAYAIDHTSLASARAHQAADLMRNWDGQVTADSAAATLVAHSRRELVRLLLEPKLGQAWREYQSSMSSVWLENVLERQPPHWMPPGYASWDDLLAAAVDAAVKQKPAPANLSDWRWGKEEPLEINHPLFGKVPWLRGWTGTGQVAQSGNSYTAKQVRGNFGPSERMTVDFADFDRSTLNLVNGQSGQVFSPHYMDQWKAWYGGTTFTLPFSAPAIAQAKAHVLVLKPGR